MIRVGIVDDHDLVREGVRALLERDPELVVAWETGDGQEAIKLARELRADVILMDVNLPGGIGGLEATETILAEHPELKIIILTQYESLEYIKRAIRIGAQGYLIKRSVSDQLMDAIRTVHGGRRYLHPLAADEIVDLLARGESLDEEDDYERLTLREKQVFKLLAEGKTSRDISKYLNVSLKTAMTHRSNLMAKLKLHSRAELIKYAIRRSIIQVDDP